MANLLYLAHRLPRAGDSGPGRRAFQLLRHLAARHRVFLGTFVEAQQERADVQALQPYCAGLYTARRRLPLARLASLRALPRRQALTLGYHRHAGLQRWVRTLAARESIDAAVVCSSSMAQYLDALPQLPLLVDFMDVDSAKWTQVAPVQRWPLSWLYGREGRTLLAHERAVAARARRAFFASEAEAALFRLLAPESAGRVETLGDGVDADHFMPDPRHGSPFGDEPHPLVFAGDMDCWPHVDAMCWFAREVLPRLLPRWPGLRLHIVGRNPTAAVQALAGPHVSVTGAVPDVRPYLQHAAVVVAPLRLARGVQRPILEAIAMSRPVVASLTCTQALRAEPGREVVAALEAEEYVHHIDVLLSRPELADAIGQAGRQRVLRSYSWGAHLARVEQHLHALAPTTAGAAPRTPGRALAVSQQAGAEA